MSSNAMNWSVIVENNINGSFGDNESLWSVETHNLSSTQYSEGVLYNFSEQTSSDCIECDSIRDMEGNLSKMDVERVSQDQELLFDVPVSIIIVLSILYGGISAAALVGNTLVLWIVAISRRMRTVTNMFIANLALADIIIGLFAIPFQFQAALLQRWNLPDFMCGFCPFVQVLSVNVSVLTLSAIAVDRYRAVLFPLSARVSKKKAGWTIVSIWSVGLLLAFPTQLDYKVIYVPDHKLNSSQLKPFCANVGLNQYFRVYYNLGVMVIQYFFPLIIITGAYAHMATKLWGATAPGNKEESRDAAVLRNKKKVIKMLALVVLLFAVCWLPLQSYNLLSQIWPAINQYKYINVVWFSFHWLAMSNAAYNPAVYAIYNDKFQREFRARLWFVRRLCSKNTDGRNYSDSSEFIDKSKIRATYRFTNTRPVSRTSVYNPSGIYGGYGSRTTNIDSVLEYSNASRYQPPSPIFLGSGRCRGRIDRPHNFYECSGNCSIESVPNHVESRGLNGNDFESIFLHEEAGSPSARVIVNYERNGIVSSSTVPINNIMIRADTTSTTVRNAGRFGQIEVDLCCD